MPILSLSTGSSVLYVTAVLLYAQYSILEIQGVPLDDFFEFNLTSPDMAGETLFPQEDDADHYFHLSVPFLFYNKSYTRINVNTNGILAFGDNAADVNYTPMQFPRPSNVPVVAPYWADIDTTGTGQIWVRNTANDSTAINKVTNLVATHFEDFPNFVAEELLIVTWYGVGYYNSQTNKVNTFQCVLASDGTITFTILLYLDDGINWTTGDENGGNNGLGGTQAQAGFDAGNQNNYTEIEGSFTDDIINIEEKSNVGVPGLFIFQINGFTIRAADEEPCPVVGTSACKERIVNAACSYIRSTRSANEVPLPCRHEV